MSVPLRALHRSAHRTAHRRPRAEDALMFRRRILILADPASAQPRLRAALEDDFHHFRVELQARDGRIAWVHSEALRLPYTLCGEAPRALQALVDAPLSPVAHAVTRVTDPTGQCTHLLELAGLA